MRVVFMGTPEFAIPTLKALYNSGYKVDAVITQPDKPKGRGRKLVSPPIKDLADSLGLKVLQPMRINELGFIEQLQEIKPDIIVVVAYGQILPKEILELPSYGCINIHASLLPKLRGAAPINWSIINGDKVTGITTMFMDEGLDTGDIILQKVIKICEEETAGELHDKLANLGGDVLIETIKSLKNKTVNRIKQNNHKATYAPMLTKKMGRIDWSLEVKDIKNLIRGVHPWPGAYSYYDDNMFKIFSAQIIDKESINNDWGQICDVGKDYFTVKCKIGLLDIKEIQFQNGKRMTVDEYLRGHDIVKGKILS